MNADNDKKQPRKKGFYIHALLLGGFALVASGLLAAADRFSAPAIAQRQTEDLQRSLGQVLPPRGHDNDPAEDTIMLPGPDGKPLTVYQAKRDGRVVAVAFRISGEGYGGPIKLVMGIDKSGRILGVRVLAHNETPGLGDNIETSKSSWILGFSGLSFVKLPKEKWKVKKDGGAFDQFSGATITPRAVVLTVKNALAFFNAHKAAMLAPAAPTSPPEKGKG
ncbi:electron transport complex subunit RsxG [Varunaivibrio sulfuroxidans]|uniref:Ion-translocating oxidoreductase complex subunit G n=1 Tax=Varunaivibrio sulfuroxidans TaxID=1773489 RepID=A0A4R3J9N8_9PROT|nr:electron transport complex subunit RsxG [Varunaivibrio sulfuroxidans]TCS61726.1 electron transport complex protein RnfG [Varunaivibrio sulfuroxidans]WES32089.1 electron transport complex subunit RsxG [Varunaivibrio sulfuroxidans]